MRALGLLVLVIGGLFLSGCASGEVQSSDVEAYQKAGLPNGSATETKDSARPER